MQVVPVRMASHAQLELELVGARTLVAPQYWKVMAVLQKPVPALAERQTDQTDANEPLVEMFYPEIAVPAGHKLVAVDFRVRQVETRVWFKRTDITLVDATGAVFVSFASAGPDIGPATRTDSWLQQEFIETNQLAGKTLLQSWAFSVPETVRDGSVMRFKDRSYPLPVLALL